MDTPNEAKVVVRPNENPTLSPSGPIAHFFGEETTNVFMLKRDGNSVSSSVSGCNESLNATGNVFQTALRRGPSGRCLDGPQGAAVEFLHEQAFGRPV